MMTSSDLGGLRILDEPYYLETGGEAVVFEAAC